MERTTTDFVSIKEFAGIVGVHPNTVRRSIKRGRISAFKIGSGKKSIYRIARTEINRLSLCDMEEMIEKIIEKRKSLEN